MRIAGQRTIAEWGEASKMPPLAFILDRTVEAVQYREDKQLLNRPDKPEEWEALGRRLGITAAQVQEWLEAGKEAQNEHIAKLEADPEWQAMAARLGGLPGLSPKRPMRFESEADRKAWATKQAKESGWLP